MAENLEQEIESLVNDHQEWIENHERCWENSKTGEKAYDENMSLDQLTAYTDQLKVDIDEILES